MLSVWKSLLGNRHLESSPQEICSMLWGDLFCKSQLSVSVTFLIAVTKHLRTDGRKDLFRLEAWEGSVLYGEVGRDHGGWDSSHPHAPGSTEKGMLMPTWLPSFPFNSFWKAQPMPHCYPHFRVCLPCLARSLLKSPHRIH